MSSAGAGLVWVEAGSLTAPACSELFPCLGLAWLPDEPEPQAAPARARASSAATRPVGKGRFMKASPVELD
jgi:hypothetical protein